MAKTTKAQDLLFGIDDVRGISNTKKYNQLKRISLTARLVVSKSLNRMSLF